MRISTTTLESFRLWSQPEQDWMTEAELVASSRGAFRPTTEGLLGKAFGAVLEQPGRYQVKDGYDCQGHFFSDEMMAPALRLMDPGGVFEAKAVKRYANGIDVVAKADQLV